MYAGIVRSFPGCRRLGSYSDGMISMGSLEVVSSSVGDSTGSATVGLARILISASRSLAVKLRPRCSKLGRLGRRCDMRDDPPVLRPVEDEGATGEEGVMVIAEGIEGSDSEDAKLVVELALERVVVTSSEFDRVRVPRGHCLELF
jgi:hypothetical protein